MPYKGEFANKTAHIDFVKNPDVRAFLKSCEYLTQPSPEEAKRIVAPFREPPRPANISLPAHVLAVDGSPHEASHDALLPSTKIGFIKIGAVLFSLHEYGSLRSGRYVDPFRVARLQDNNASLTFVVPSSNIRIRGKKSVRDSFRAALDAQFLAEATRFDSDNFHTSLRSTLFHLAHRRPDDMGTGDPFRLKLHKCPTCKKGPIELEDKPEQQYCPHCEAEVYPTDCLRLWEEINDYQSNQLAITRLMMLLEHLLPIHYMRFIAEKDLSALSKMAFFVDGPLAIFGTAAWLHRSIMDYLAEMRNRLGRPVLMIGLVKTGQVVDHVNLLDRFIPKNRLLAIDDDYRYKYILAGRDPAGNGFGYETYYGQDFILKTQSGRTFVFCLPYPFPNKNLPGTSFLEKKVEWDQYPQLATVVHLIEQLESDLYRNAVVPIALAHRYTAISLRPGGKVLDLLLKKNLE
ncbi:MAG: DNA double-strand break repair nuclease NurA [Gammaproteobacteria bacterium]|nr:MAG: DNA double-strand break repair nuclease NurA [Gammaproteobacteria bacterium]